MSCNQSRKVTRPIIDGVLIICGLATAQCIAILPIQITGNSRRGQSCGLPGTLDRRLVRLHAVLFEEARLADRRANGAVSFNPAIAEAKSIFCAPFTEMLVRSENGKVVILT